jgi:hypothetical protein
MYEVTITESQKAGARRLARAAAARQGARHR